MLSSKITYNTIVDTWDFDYIKHLADCDVCDEILSLWYDLGYYDQIATDERYVRDLALILHVDYAEFLRYLNTCLSEKKLDKSFLSCEHKFSFISYICNQEEIIRSLDVNSFAELLNTIRRHDNRLQQAFFLKNMIDFCIRNSNDILFKNGIHYIMMEILYRHFLESTAGTLYYNKLSLLVRNKFFQGRYFETKKKVALCLTGVLRPGWRDSIKDLIDSFSTFDIDVFVYSWNEESLWPGVGGNGIGWIRRFFHPIIKECPKELILSNTDFAKLFPKVFDILSNEITSKIEDKDIFILSEKIKRVKLESYSNVMQSIGDIKNDSKIYYGIYQVFRLLEEYEIQNNFKYDFIIRVRSDYKIVKNHITYDDLHKLGLNEIYSARYNCGIDGSLEIGRRSAMDTYMNTWHHISLNKNIPFFKGCFEKYPMTCMSTSGFLSHYILSQWIEYLGLRVVRLDIEFTHINHHLFENIQFPDISKELNEDLRMLRNNNALNSSQIQDISSFFEVIFNTYTIIKNRVHLNAKIVNSEHSAKARIQNQLSYKLGQAMIVNSKSFLGYIRMPFVLSYIKDKHKQEQKIYQEKIKKDPSLALPPLESYPDYQEALKLKNHLSYKLGQALMQANKTWYGGGVYQVAI